MSEPPVVLHNVGSCPQLPTFPPRVDWQAALEEARRENLAATHAKDRSHWWPVVKALERLVPYLADEQNS